MNPRVWSQFGIHFDISGPHLWLLLWSWCPIKLLALSPSSEVLTLELRAPALSTGLSRIDPAKML